MKTVINVKVDKETKDSANEVAKSAGLTLSALINSFLHQVSATRRIEIYAPEKMTPKMEKIIAQIEAEIERGEISQGFENADDFLADLKK